jgi:flagellin-like protein
MIQKMRDLPILAYLAVTGFFRDFKKDERGLSDVVTAVLLILVAVMLVVIVWGFASGFIQNVWSDITNAAASITP